jgi:hypothetical protein
VPAAVDFGDVYPWSETVRAVTVSNGGDVPVLIDGVEVAGAQAAAFGIDADGCGGQTVAPDEACSLVVRFVEALPGPVPPSCTSRSTAPPRSISRCAPTARASP